MKKIGIIAVGVVACLAVVAVALVLVLDNSHLKPSTDHLTTFVATRSPYAVKVLYDAQKRPIDIVVVKAKSGVTVAHITPKEEVVRYEVTEVGDIRLAIALYNAKDELVDFKSFDTKAGKLVEL